MLQTSCSLSRCLRGNLGPADELSGVADEPLSLSRCLRPVDKLSGVVESCSLSRCLRGNLAPADELSGVADELLSLQVSQRQSAPADELSGVVDERRCRRLISALFG